MFNRPGNLPGIVNSYLKKIEKWLCKWRLKMAPSKCNYTLFAPTIVNLTKHQKLLSSSLMMFGEQIPYEANPVSLGIIFDEKLNFSAQVKRIKNKCSSRLNLIRILSHKSWQLNKSTLLTIYQAMVGSVLDYSAFILPRLSENLRTTLQAVQNKAIRIIFRKRPGTKTIYLCRLANLVLLSDRMHYLNIKYICKALISENELILSLFKEYCRAKFKFLTIEEQKKTLIYDYLVCYRKTLTDT